MKKFLSPVLAAAALVGCTKENQGVTYADNEILASATTLSVDAVTKAPVNGTVSSSAPFFAQVPISETSGNYSSPIGDPGYMNFTDQSTAFGFVNASKAAAPKFFPAGVNTVYLCGLYPATGWSSISETAQFTFDGSDDVMAAKEVSLTKENAAAGTYSKLAFEHLLTQISVSFHAASKNDVYGWGNITGLELLASSSTEGAEVKLANVATVDLDAGTVSFGGTTGTGFYDVTGTDYTDDAYTSTAIPYEPTPASVVAYTMCAPVTADGSTDAEYKLKITSASGAVETVDINLKDANNTDDFNGSTAGYSFEIALNFKATEVKAIASIAEWKDGGTTTVTVGE